MQFFFDGSQPLSWDPDFQLFRRFPVLLMYCAGSLFINPSAKRLIPVSSATDHQRMLASMD
jgi:hypothetical protein